MSGIQVTLLAVARGRICRLPHSTLRTADVNCVSCGICGIDRHRGCPARNLVIVLKSVACGIGGQRHRTQRRPSAGCRQRLGSCLNDRSSRQSSGTGLHLGSIGTIAQLRGRFPGNHATVQEPFRSLQVMSICSGDKCFGYCLLCAVSLGHEKNESNKSASNKARNARQNLGQVIDATMWSVWRSDAHGQSEKRIQSRIRTISGSRRDKLSASNAQRIAAAIALTTQDGASCLYNRQ